MSSTFSTRWGLPLALIGAALLLSGFVFFVKLPEPARIMDARAGLAFLGTPAVGLLVLLMLRVAARDGADRGADLVILWVLTFLFGVHATVLATSIGMVPSLRTVIPYGVALLLIGLGPTVATLAPGSPLGVRTSSTLADDDLWRRTHRLTGFMLTLAGVAGLGGALYGGRWTLVAGIGPAVVALTVALVYGSQAPRAPNRDKLNRDKPNPDASVPEASVSAADEQNEAGKRPTQQASTPGDSPATDA